MEKIKRSEFLQAVSKSKQQVVNTEKKYQECRVLELHLEDGSTFFFDVTDCGKYRIKNNALYKGLFKKVGNITFVRIDY